MRIRFRPFLFACGALAALQSPAWADTPYRFTLLEENDSPYFNTDKHYTQGLRLSVLSPAIESPSVWNGSFDFAERLGPVFGVAGWARQPERRIAMFLGQSIFAPQNIALKPPDPKDRPYAGWLYVGTSLLQETNGRTLENLELDLGVIGPGTLARQTQNDFHQFIGVAPARGWSHELQTEPGGMLTYERLWRIPLIGNGAAGVDFVPQLGVTVGNVMTYGAAGGTLRIGKNLRADYGTARIRPALSGTDYFDAEHLDGPLGFYFFAGAQARAVAQNIFLDGNSFRQSPSIGKRALVTDLQAGFSLFWSSAWRIEVSGVRRSREYSGQHTSDVVGTALVAFSF